MGQIKTNDEIKKLRKAARLGDSCFEYICSQIKIDMTEKEIAAEIDNFIINNGALKASFETIVGSAENSAFIHSTPTDRKIEFGDIILLDFGCILDNYCSDMSRTIFVGEAKEEYKRIYEIVLKAQLETIKNIRTLMKCSDIDKIARTIINSYGYDFNHSVGHGIGTEVHEEPIISSKSNETVKNNMVFSIEPGIYLEGKFGVRIEDVIVINNGIPEILSLSPKDIIII